MMACADHHPCTSQHCSHRSHGYERLGIHRHHYERTSTTPSRTHPVTAGVTHSPEVPPLIFNGDRDKSELFLDKFISYEIVNGDSWQFTTPFLKVALCLSYMNGPKIDSWARHRRLWLKAQKDAGVSMMDQSLWDDFEANFRRAYAYQDAKLTAYQN